ncbi:MAG: hypothetical protein JJT96_14990 [Opitutales bacterium]|nr:hypothetical protein [Opitutales bacterium]
MSEERYVRLVGWTGRRLRDDEAGAIPADLAPPDSLRSFPFGGTGVLERLELDVANWITTVERYGSLYHRVAGNVEKLREATHSVWGSGGSVGVTGRRARGCIGWHEGRLQPSGRACRA